MPRSTKACELPVRIASKVHFVDCVVAHHRGEPSRELLRKLRRGCRGGVHAAASKQRWGYWRVSLPQPSREAVELLASLPRGTVQMTKLEVANDLVVASKRDAYALDDWVQRRLYQRWGRKPAIRKPGFAQRQTNASAAYGGRRIACYSDRVSKAAGQPCTHVEVRICGAAVLRRAALRTIDDLFAIDARELFAKSVGLAEANFDRLRRSLSNENDGNFKVAALRWIHAEHDAAGFPVHTAETARHTARCLGRHSHHALDQLDAAPVLPESGPLRFLEPTTTTAAA